MALQRRRTGSGEPRRPAFVGTGRPYWAPLDGVRGAAVLAVVLFHTGRHPFRAGFVGVDAFFVLSGFLITSLLLDELRSTHRLGMRSFYERRALRILPALVAVCVGVVLIAAVAGVHVRSVAAGAVSALLFVANIWIYSGHNTILLQQTWTLSLEEQFYLIWPILLVAAFFARRTARIVIFVACAAAWAALILVPLHGVADHIRFTYTRAAGLPLGCLLALSLPWIQRRIPAVVLKVTCVLAAVFLAFSVLFPVVPTGLFSPPSVSLGAVLTVPILAGLILAPPVGLAALLTTRLARWMGRRSYAIYLWHYPLLSIAINHGHRVPLAVRTLAAIAATLVISELSWRLVETRFLRRKNRYEPTTRPA